MALFPTQPQSLYQRSNLGGKSKSQTTTQQEKGTDCWYMQQLGLISGALCRVKEANPKIWHIVHSIYIIFLKWQHARNEAQVSRCQGMGVCWEREGQYAVGGIHSSPLLTSNLLPSLVDFSPLNDSPNPSNGINIWIRAVDPIVSMRSTTGCDMLL